MTQAEALSGFRRTMTDTEMRHLWRRLETEGCYIIRYNPTSYADTRHLWRMRITNPAWSVSPAAEHGIGVYYEHHDDGLWTALE